jgi:hypothetical protein
VKRHQVTHRLSVNLSTVLRRQQSPLPRQPQRPIKRSAPAPLGQISTSLEGSGAVPPKLHFARGLDAPSEARDDKTSPRPQLCDFQPSVSPTLELAYERRPNKKDPMPLPLKPLLDGHRTRCDVPPEGRFARTATNSTTLYTIPPHVA